MYHLHSLFGKPFQESPPFEAPYRSESRSQSKVSVKVSTSPPTMKRFSGSSRKAMSWNAHLSNQLKKNGGSQTKKNWNEIEAIGTRNKLLDHMCFFLCFFLLFPCSFGCSGNKTLLLPNITLSLRLSGMGKAVTRILGPHKWTTSLESPIWDESMTYMACHSLSYTGYWGIFELNPLDLSLFAHQHYLQITPWKTNMTMENQPVEDVSPFNMVISHCHVSLREGIFIYKGEVCRILELPKCMETSPVNQFLGRWKRHLSISYKQLLESSGWPRGACTKWLSKPIRFKIFEQLKCEGCLKPPSIQYIICSTITHQIQITQILNFKLFLSHHHPSPLECVPIAPFPSWVHQREWEPRWIFGPPPSRRFSGRWHRLEDRSSMNHGYSTNHPLATYPPQKQGFNSWPY